MKNEYCKITFYYELVINYICFTIFGSRIIEFRHWWMSDFNSKGGLEYTCFKLYCHRQTNKQTVLYNLKLGTK